MQIKYNPDKEVVDSIQRSIRENGGYCPCQVEKTEDTRCMCTEFLNQALDPEFTGYCRCMLYCITK